MSLQVHILDAYLHKFKDNKDAHSEEQGERFHQYTLDFERRYQGQYNENKIRDYIWGFFEKAICSTLANIENLIIPEPL